jgi:hypothetical protein
MRPREAAVMRLWLRVFEDAYDAFEYNVRIGPSRDPGPSYPGYVRRTAMMSSQLRIDAVAWDGLTPTLIELKHNASPRGVQQLAVYGAVWRLEHLELPPPKLLLVCTGVLPGVIETAAAAGVTVHVVDGSP